MPCYKDRIAPCMKTYVYDGGLAGFFCLVYDSFSKNELPMSIIKEEDYTPTFFERVYVETNEETAAKVRNSLKTKISPRALELVENVFLTSAPEKEIIMLKFIITAYDVGKAAPLMLAHPDVSPMLDAERHLLSEVHLLKGFVRFTDYGEILGAVISPKNFALPYLAKHFIYRFPRENFIIYDNVHKAALIYQDGQAEITGFEEIEFAPISENELKYQKLWKRFYKTIGIKERFNPKCRMTLMPKRYWENMTEMKDYL